MQRARFVAPILAAGALMALGAPATAHAGCDAAEAKYTINFGSAAPDTTPWAMQLQDIKERIEKESECKIVVRLFLGSVLGGEVEMVQDIVEGGRLNAGGFSTAAVATGANIPALQLPEFPFLFNDNAEVDHVLDTVLFDPMAKKMKRRNLTLAYWAENGWRSFFTKQEPATTLEALRKHKMRVQESEVHKAMYEALGVQAVPLPTLEVLDGLNRGTVDGFDNTTLFGQASGWSEPTKYYTLTKHIYQPAAIVYNREWFEALPEDLQKIVIGDRVAETKNGRDGVRSEENKLQASFSDMDIEIVTPTQAQIDAFRQAVLPVHDKFKDQVGADLYDAVVAALKAYRAK